MRTFAIVLLAAVNLGLLVSVSLPLFRSGDPAAADAAAQTAQTAQTTQTAPAGPVRDSTRLKVAPIAARESSQEPAVPYLYVNQSGVDPSQDHDSKTVADLKDVKNVEPIAELLPGGQRVLTGPGDPNSEFVANQSSANGKSSSGGSSKPFGLLAPAQPINIAPPTVSEETPP